MPSRAASSARGGRNSAANTGLPERRAVRMSGTDMGWKDWKGWKGWKERRAYNPSCPSRPSRPSCLSGSSMCLEDFVNQEQIGEQCTEVDRGIQIVDELGADRGLCEHQSNGRDGVARIAIDHVHECGIRLCRFNVQALDEAGDELRQTRQRPFAFGEELANLSAGAARVLVFESLPGIREHELVAFFDGVAPSVELGARLFQISRPCAHARPERTFQRAGS